MARPYDLIVFGATGDAGRAIARYLGGAAPPSLKWAIGGRSVSKLEKVRASVRAACPKATFDVVIASCDDDASMTAMTRSARLVLSAAGPYEKLGEPVIVACIAGGAHYCDITGELDWVGAMRTKHDAAARKAGVTLLSFCGYDCVPCELSALAARGALPAADATLASVESVVSLTGGGMPRGTLITMFSKAGQALSFARGILAFCPDDATRARTVASLGYWLLPWWSAHARCFTIPHFMGWCNTPVVHASLVASGNGAGALGRYNDRMRLPGSGWYTLFGLPQLVATYAALAVLTLPVMLALSLPGVGPLFVRALEACYSYGGDAASACDFRTRGWGARGAVVDVALVVPGDAGIHATALCAGEAAMAALALDDKAAGAKTPTAAAAAMPAGFHSPAAALGATLVERMRAVDGVTLTATLTTEGGTTTKCD